MISNPYTLQTIWENRSERLSHILSHRFAHTYCSLLFHIQMLNFCHARNLLHSLLNRRNIISSWLFFFLLHVCRFQLVPNWLARSNSLICAHSANGRNLNSAHTSVSRSHLRLVCVCVCERDLKMLFQFFVRLVFLLWAERWKRNQMRINGRRNEGGCHQNEKNPT